VAPGSFKDTWWPFFKKEIEEKYPVLLFWKFRIKWIYVVILDIFSYVQYFYTQINNNQMQIELFNNIFEEFIKCFRPFKSNDADLAQNEHEFYTPALKKNTYKYKCAV